MSASDKRLATVLLALCAVTAISWWLGARNGAAATSLDAHVTIGVLLIAAAKVRIIIMEFMEARHAPRLLRRLIDAWLALLISALLTVYLWR